MRYTASSFSTLVILWLLLSGHYSTLHIALGVASCLIVVGVAIRMSALDEETQPWHMGLWLAGYWIWLLGQIARSNVAVIRRILSRAPAISPTLVRVPAHEKTELGQTIFANSITLTPGTVSVSLLQGDIEVHALSKEGARDLAGGEMDRRVQALESNKAGNA